MNNLILLDWDGVARELSEKRMPQTFDALTLFLGKIQEQIESPYFAILTAAGDQELRSRIAPVVKATPEIGAILQSTPEGTGVYANLESTKVLTRNILSNLLPRACKVLLDDNPQEGARKLYRFELKRSPQVPVLDKISNLTLMVNGAELAYSLGLENSAQQDKLAAPLIAKMKAILNAQKPIPKL